MGLEKPNANLLDIGARSPAVRGEWKELLLAHASREHGSMSGRRPGARAQAGADFRRPEGGGGCPKVEIPAVFTTKASAKKNFSARLLPRSA